MRSNELKEAYRKMFNFISEKYMYINIIIIGFMLTTILFHNMEDKI